MKVRIDSTLSENSIKLHFEDIERANVHGHFNGRPIELSDLIGKTITYIEESELVNGDIILTLEWKER